MQDRYIGVRVSQETLTEIDALAKKLEFTRSATVKLMLKYGLTKVKVDND